MKYIHVFFLLLPGLVCLTTPVVAQQQEALIAGSGGGLTGVATAYKIFADGRVCKGKGVGDIQYTACATIRKSKARKIIRRAVRAVSAAGSLQAPGNLYYFLATIQKGKESKVTWGAAGQPVPAALKEVYSDVQTLVADLTYHPMP